MSATMAIALALQAGVSTGDAPPVNDKIIEGATEQIVGSQTGVADAASETALAAPAPQIVLPRDTPVHLMVINEVSTKDHSAGHKFRLRVNQPVIVDGKELIAVGTTAWGELTEAEKSGNTGKRGKLSAILTHIDLDGTTIPIEGGTEADGKSGKGETILGVLAMGPLGLFAKGNNAKIKAGEKMTAFVSEDVVIGNAE